MKENAIEEEIRSIRVLMERSSKFISLSGLSGVLAGLYALVGAFISYRTLRGVDYYDVREVPDITLVGRLMLVGIAVFVLAVGSGIWLTSRRAKKNGQRFWNPSSKALIANFGIPLFTGGIFILLLIYRGYYGLVAPSCLIFYGLALIAASHYTFGDVKWLGMLEVVLGLAAGFLPGYGLYFWVMGFGILHILYGTIMYFKYER